MSETMWMVRAGEGGYRIEEFAKGYVAIGWMKLGDLSNVKTLDDIKALHEKVYADESVSRASNVVAMLHKFRSLFEIGSYVVTYDTDNREYLIGTIASDYYFSPDEIADYAHLRQVDWQGRVSRDQLSATSRNTLGSTLTLFSINEDVTAELLSMLSGREPVRSVDDNEDEKEELDQIQEDIIARAHELIKDKLLKLTARQMELLTAAILRAMGYQTRVTRVGPDRGLDVFASPDGLGLEEPRIKVEVKHQPKTAKGSQDLRSFLGGLREGDRAIYVSTGGFTKEAGYEADRSTIPLTLLNLDDLADLIVIHYENFDVEGKLLIPLVKIYWPVE